MSAPLATGCSGESVIGLILGGAIAQSGLRWLASVEWTRRLSRTAAIGLAPALLTLAASPVGGWSAQAATPTKVLGVEQGSPARVGEDVDLRVDALDPDSPVSGMVVRFGSSRTSVFGLSACRAQDPLSGPVGPPFSPGSRVRMTAPHRYRKRGRRRVTVRLDSGGCAAPLDSVFQQVTVTPTDPGEPPIALEVGPLTLTPPPNAGDWPVPMLDAIPGAIAATAGQVSAGAVASARRKRAVCPGSGQPPRRSPEGLRAARVTTLCLLNVQRRKFRLPRLRGNSRLRRAAEGHSRSMVERGFFSHVGPGGLGLVDRVLRAGYLNDVRGWSVGENIGYGTGRTSSPKVIVRAWMGSTGHRANILTRSYDEIGLGVVKGVPGNRRAGATFTTVFGRRS